jgi:predicted metal-dependent hydrolase
MPIVIDNLVRTRRRTIALIVQPDGTLTVRAPLHLPEARIRHFVEAHADWIARQRERIRRSGGPPVRRQYRDGESFLLLGESHPLQIVPAQRPALTFDGRSFRLSRAAVERGEAAFIRWYRQQAAAHLTGRVAALAAAHGFSWKKVCISSARTRWGSCSSTGTLSFPWRLVLAPPEVIDYVVLHELVHTQVRNHSRAFWAQVARRMPEYKTHVRWLKQHGQKLSL